MNENFKGLSTILKTTEAELYDLCLDVMAPMYGQEFDCGTKDMYLYFKGSSPVMLVAHLDTVHKTPPLNDLYFDPKAQVLWSPSGIGGDDRAGVWAILEIIKTLYSKNKPLPSVLFCKKEEVGMLGAQSAVKGIKPKPDVKFIIEIDRKGEKEAVFYSCGNQEFMDFIISYGFEKQTGMCSDISTLAPAWDVAAVNVSCGGYDQHQKSEYIVLPHTEAIINMVLSILLEMNESTPYFDYQEAIPVLKQPKFTNNGKSYYNDIDYSSNDYYGDYKLYDGIYFYKRRGEYTALISGDHITLKEYKKAKKELPVGKVLRLEVL